MASLPETVEETHSQKTLGQFFATFGDAKDVKAEVLEHWKNTGKLDSPQELYNYLMDKRVSEKKIAAEPAELLKKIFADSFLPEHSTGYLAKHREPLVNGLAQLYADEAKPEGPVWHIGGDISNLGGLNISLEEAAKKLAATGGENYQKLLAQHHISADDPEAASRLGRVVADRVLHTICQFAWDEMGKEAQLIPLRKGGDEISFIATNIDEASLKRVLKTTQTAVAQLVKSSGLVIPHAKHPEDRWKAGVGLGLDAVDMRLHTIDDQQRLISRGIPISKNNFQRILHHEGIQKIDSVDIEKVVAVLDNVKQFSEFKPRIPSAPPLDVTDGPSPDHQRYMALAKLVKAAGDAPLTSDQTQALDRAIGGTHALIRKNDFVTNLPQFENMQQEQLPFFMHTSGRKAGAKLVNVDFSGVAAGNELSENLGNIMIRKYRDVMLGAVMNPKNTLAEYAYSIAVRPGGKFTMLVPGDVSDDVMASFARDLQQRMAEAVKQPIQLNPSLRKEIERNLVEMPELAKKYGETGQDLRDSQGNLHFSVSQLINSKTQLPGAQAVMAYSREPIDTTTKPHSNQLIKSLGSQLKPLESQVEHRHKHLNSYRETEGMNWVDRAKYLATKMENENAADKLKAGQGLQR